MEKLVFTIKAINQSIFPTFENIIRCSMFDKGISITYLRNERIECTIISLWHHEISFDWWFSETWYHKRIFMTKATTKGDAVEIFLQSFCQLVILLVSSFSQFDVMLFALFFISHPSFCVLFRFEIAKNNEPCVDTFLCTLDWYFYSFCLLPNCKLKNICVGN